MNETDDTTPTERDGDTTPTERIEDTAPTLRLDETAPAADFSAASIGGRYATTSELASQPRPRVRSGAIVWGVIVMAFAALVLIITAVPGNASAFADWTTSLSPAAITVLAVVVVGVLVLLIAGLSAIRRAQRRAPRP